MASPCYRRRRTGSKRRAFDRGSTSLGRRATRGCHGRPALSEKCDLTDKAVTLRTVVCTEPPFSQRAPTPRHKVLTLHRPRRRFECAVTHTFSPLNPVAKSPDLSDNLPATPARLSSITKRIRNL